MGFLFRNVTSLVLKSRISNNFQLQRIGVIINSIRCYNMRLPPKAKPKTKSMFIYTKKFLDGGMIEPKLIWQTPSGLTKTGSGKYSPKFLVSKTTARRINILNKVFLESIIDIMASGEVGDKLLGQQVHITKVRVLEDLMGVWVYWLQGGGIVPAPGQLSTEELLQWAAPLIRNELASRGVVGKVPPLTFKPDIELTHGLEVEAILRNLKREEELAEAQAEHKEAAIRQSIERLEVPARMFSPDFVFTVPNFDPNVFNVSPRHRPQSSYTPFAPHGNSFRVRAADEGAEDGPSVKRQAAPQHTVSLLSSIFDLNRDRIIAKVENSVCRQRGISREKTYPFAEPGLGPHRDDSANPNEAPYASKSELRKWATDYAKKGDRDPRLTADEVKNLQCQDLLLEEQWRELQQRHDDECGDLEDMVMKRTDSEDYWDDKFDENDY